VAESDYKRGEVLLFRARLFHDRTGRSLGDALTRFNEDALEVRERGSKRFIPCLAVKEGAQ
jgi:hypothetical protein